MTARLLHGDTPAADADAALTFVVERSGYAAVHIGAVLAAATIAIGITALASSLTRPSAWLRNTRLRDWRTGRAVVLAQPGLYRRQKLRCRPLEPRPRPEHAVDAISHHD